MPAGGAGELRPRRNHGRLGTRRRSIKIQPEAGSARLGPRRRPEVRVLIPEVGVLSGSAKAEKGIVSQVRGQGLPESLAHRAGAATPAGQPPSSRGRLPARRTVYCMNEAELVNVALSILIEGRRQKNPPEKDTARPGNGEHSRTPLMSPRSEGTSEDENSGAEALPPSTTPSQGSQNSDSALTCSQNPAEEDDTLKYVREIFFS
ncbi:PREDICTED: modulator of retrovirus infection homolog [Elephantulus edwardii]|uniref:modulator of retrovirus infection homolog n=1 Tax=Elephantulus edwardii TaxID=28737 RepID=UPI0003F0D783|nr:PREDICTED: modulator of retrovirus infection homolog [Elephantulus edwardii]